MALSKSFKVINDDTIRRIVYDFLSIFHSIYLRLLYFSSRCSQLLVENRELFIYRKYLALRQG